MEILYLGKYKVKIVHLLIIASLEDLRTGRKEGYVYIPRNIYITRSMPLQI